MKYLIFSDCHWSTYTSILRSRGKKYSTRLEYLIESLNWVNKVAIDYNCNTMICAGDFMDKAQCTDEELTALREIDWNNLGCYFVCGNHESSVLDLRFSSIKALESDIHFICSKVTLINDPEYNIILLPYITDKERKPLADYLSQLTLDNNKPNIIISHNDIAGIQYGGFESMSGFSIKEIEANCDLFLNGHLHNSERITNKIINVGSFSAHNFTNDSLRYKYGIWLLDTETRALEFIENPYSLQFYKFDVLNASALNNLNKIVNNSIVSIKCLDTLQESVKNKLDELSDKILENRIILTRGAIEKLENDIVLPTLSSDYFKKFAEFCNTNIDVDKTILSAEIAEICK